MYIFYHLYCINDYVKRTESTFSKIVESRLIDEITNIFVNVDKNVSDQSIDLECFKHEKVVITKEADCSFGELDTLKKLWSFCKTLEYNTPILYLHCKGVSDNNFANPNVHAWIEFMEYFTIKKWQDCINVLNTYDTCSVNLRTEPSLHYSGNFWWANSDYNNKIPQIDPKNCSNVMFFEDKPNSYAEFWLLDNNFCRPYCLHNADTNHYVIHYDKSNYIN